MALFALLALFLPTVLADDCGIHPVFVDYHARLVDGGLSYQYGLFVGVGTNSQNQSLWPSLVNNETTFSGVHFCENSPDDRCANETHGYYEPVLSQTYRNKDFESLDTTDFNGLSIEEQGTDNLNIFTHYFDPSPPNLTSLVDFPITVLSNWTSNTSPWFGPSGQLGLGPSSTVLRHLHDQGLIASRSFGLYTGTAYTRAGGAINGSLTFGGYDSGRWKGELHNFTMADISSATDGSTPFKVTVNKVTLNDDSGRTDLNSEPFDAYISTSQFDISLPKDATTKFESLTNAEVKTTDYDISYAIPSYAGSMTLTLSTGLIVTIPNSDLRNRSNISPISALPKNSPSVPVLGTAFLSYIYLIARYDATPPSFHLASAFPEALYVQTQPLCAETIPTPAASMKVSSFAANGLIGAILGGVIGGIGLAFTIWWCLRRHFQRKAHREFEASLPMEKRQVNKRKNPITAYMREAYNTAPATSRSVLPDAGAKKTSWSSASDGEEYEMQPTPPQRQQATYFPSPQQPSYARSTSPPPTFIVGSPPISPPSSPPPTQPFSPRHNNLYSNVPLTPNTPLPLLAGYNSEREESPGPRHFGAHTRTNSDDRRQRLGLTLKTEFDPPPKKGDKGLRVAKEPKIVKMKEQGIGGKKESALRRMFPAS